MYFLQLLLIAGCLRLFDPGHFCPGPLRPFDFTGPRTFGGSNFPKETTVWNPRPDTEKSYRRMSIRGH